MAEIIKCDFLNKSGSGTSAKRVNKYTLNFRVITDDPLMPLLDVVAATAVEYGQALAEDTSAIFVDWTCDQEEACHPEASPDRPARGVYSVSLTYSNQSTEEGISTTDGSAPSGPPGQSGQDVPPEDRLPEIDIDFVSVKSFPEKDKSVPPKPIVNSAGEKFPDGVEVEDFELQVTLGYFKLLNQDSRSQAEYFRNTVNSNEFTFLGRTYDPGKLLCTQYKLTPVRESGIVCYKKTLAYQVREAGWQPKVLDRGTMTLNHYAPDQPPRPIVGDDGQPITAPVCLNGNGEPLSTTDVQAGNLVYKEFKTYTERNWSTII